MNIVISLSLSHTSVVWGEQVWIKLHQHDQSSFEKIYSEAHRSPTHQYRCPLKQWNIHSVLQLLCLLAITNVRGCNWIYPNDSSQPCMLSISFFCRKVWIFYFSIYFVFAFISRICNGSLLKWTHSLNDEYCHRQWLLLAQIKHAYIEHIQVLEAANPLYFIKSPHCYSLLVKALVDFFNI